jgi:type IV secretion system protein VirB4
MDKIAPLSRLLPWRRFIKPGVLDLRGGGICTGFDLIGPSPEVSDAADLSNRVYQQARALVHLGTGDTIYDIFSRLPAPKAPDREFRHPAAEMVYRELQEQYDRQEHWYTRARRYLSHHYAAPITSIIQALTLAAEGPRRQTRLETLQEHVYKRWASFEDTTHAAVQLRPLTNQEIFDDLVYYVTGHETSFALPDAGVHLSDAIACERWHGGDKPYVNGFHLRPICIMAYPSATVPQILAVLLRSAGYLDVCCRYICRDPYDAQRDLEVEKKHWKRTFLDGIKKILRHYSGRYNAEDDRDAVEQLADIGAATKASLQGMSFGRVTVTAIVRDTDEEEADLRARDLIRELEAMGIMARLEDNNAPKAIQGTWPGMWQENKRKVLMTGMNWSDLVLPATYWTGTPYLNAEFIPEGTPSPLVLGGGSERPPFWWPTYINGVGHQLGIGPTGTGKSTLEALLACTYLSIPDSRIFILDRGHSSYVLTHLLDGEYHDVGAQDSTPLCPLAMLDKENGIQFLMGWFERMFARRPGDMGIGRFELDERGWEDFRDVLNKAKREGIRSLDGLRSLIYGGESSRERIRRILDECVTDYGHIFGAEGPYQAKNTSVTAYEVQALSALPKHISAPAMELILQFVLCELTGVPSWVFIDEFWYFMEDEISAPWFFQGLRELRRKRASFVGFTQSTVELTQSPYCNLLLESCPSLILLPNHKANSIYAREAYLKLGVGPHEIRAISSAQPHAQYFLHTPLGSRLTGVKLGPIGQAICGSTSYADVKLFRAGYSLDEWVRERTANRESGIPIIDPAEALQGRGADLFNGSNHVRVPAGLSVRQGA